MMTAAPTQSTTELWHDTHTALCAGHWSAARRMLEELARRSDYTDQLSALTAYTTALELRGTPKVLDRGFAQLLVDRIEAVNARAERNADTSPVVWVRDHIAVVVVR